jgi:hypothetical protein
VIGRAIGPYVVLEEIVSGGQGIVYKATGQRAALKVLLDSDPNSVKRFRREALRASGLSGIFPISCLSSSPLAALLVGHLRPLGAIRT